MYILVLALACFSILPFASVTGRTVHSYLPIHRHDRDGLLDCSIAGCAPPKVATSNCGKDCAQTDSEVTTCNNGFSLSADRTRCVCSAPSTVCFGRCGLFQNGCPTRRQRRGPVPSPQPTSRLGKLSATISLLETRTLCDRDESVCGVFGGKRNSFECVNTLTRLESCGGCMIPPPTSDPSQLSSSGVDCSTLAGVLDVSCIAGKCAVTRCQHNFDISPNGTDCLPQKQISAEPTRTVALPFGKADLTLSISIAAALFASQTVAANQDQDQAFNVNEDKDQPDVFYIPGYKLPTVPEGPSQISEDQSESEANALPSAGSTLNAITQTGEQTEALEMDSDLAMSMESF